MIGPIIFLLLFIALINWLSSYSHGKFFGHTTGTYRISFKSPPKQMYVQWKVKRCADGKVAKGENHKIMYDDIINDIQKMKNCAKIAIEDFLREQELKQFQ